MEPQPPPSATTTIKAEGMPAAAAAPAPAVSMPQPLVLGIAETTKLLRSQSQAQKALAMGGALPLPLLPARPTRRSNGNNGKSAGRGKNDKKGSGNGNGNGSGRGVDRLLGGASGSSSGEEDDNGHAHGNSEDDYQPGADKHRWVCELCQYRTAKRSHLDRHFQSLQHQNREQNRVREAVQSELLPQATVPVLGADDLRPKSKRKREESKARRSPPQQDPQYSCHECSYASVSEANLKRHRAAVHNPKRRRVWIPKSGTTPGHYEPLDRNGKRLRGSNAATPPIDKPQQHLPPVASALHPKQQLLSSVMVARSAHEAMLPLRWESKSVSVPRAEADTASLVVGAPATAAATNLSFADIAKADGLLPGICGSQGLPSSTPPEPASAVAAMATAPLQPNSASASQSLAMPSDSTESTAPTAIALSASVAAHGQEVPGAAGVLALGRPAKGGEKRFKCDKCPYTSTRVGNVQRHQSVHRKQLRAEAESDTSAASTEAPGAAAPGPTADETQSPAKEAESLSTSIDDIDTASLLSVSHGGELRDAQDAVAALTAMAAGSGPAVSALSDTQQSISLKPETGHGGDACTAEQLYSQELRRVGYAVTPQTAPSSHYRGDLPRSSNAYFAPALASRLSVPRQSTNAADIAPPSLLPIAAPTKLTLSPDDPVHIRLAVLFQLFNAKGLTDKEYAAAKAQVLGWATASVNTPWSKAPADGDDTSVCNQLPSPFALPALPTATPAMSGTASIGSSPASAIVFPAAAFGNCK